MSAKVLPFRRDTSSVPTDGELMQACVGGDKNAFGEIFDRYHGPTRGFLLRMAHYNDADCDDLVQKTFLNVYQTAARYDGTSPLKSWILGIAANVVRHHRRTIARRTRLKDAAKQQPYELARGPESSTESKERLRRLEAGIARLSDKHRDIFVLCQIEGVKAKDAARSLGLPPGTVYRRLHEARQELLAWMRRDTK